MRKGNVVDPECAAKIVHACKSLVMSGDDSLVNVRPVIWSQAIANNALSEGPNPVPLPQRDLVHLVCLEDQIRVIFHLPELYRGAYSAVMVMEYRADYDGNLTHHADPKIYACSETDKRELADLYKRACKELAGRVRRHQIFLIDELVREAKEEIRPLWQSAALEAFAFSPYTAVKHRPTLKQVLNPNPKKKEWPAIEVINLRLPAKREHSEPSGRKIDIRFPVKEHLRRQPTKEGVKLITIAEHWRGPETAPVKPKTQKIYKVVK
jgi:hypothetical protein